jgi:hypothetical protein
VKDEARRIRSYPPQPDLGGKVILMAGERELTTGMPAKEASFRLIVSGNVGVKEIERPIPKAGNRQRGFSRSGRARSIVVNESGRQLRRPNEGK